MEFILSQFDNDRSAVIEPHVMKSQIEGFPKIGITAFNYSIIDAFSDMEGATKIAELITQNGNSSVYQIIYRDVPIAVFMSRVGAPACVGDFEEVIARGLEKLVMFGCCGVLEHDICDGKIIIPTSAIRDEGTSYHYAPPSDEIELDKDSVRKLIDVCKELGYPYVTGKTWTTDAFFRETRGKVEQRKKQGCIAVEMECASMAAVAQFRNVPFAQFLYAADNLDSTKWEPRSLIKNQVHYQEEYMVLALECAIRL